MKLPIRKTWSEITQQSALKCALFSPKIKCVLHVRNNCDLDSTALISFACIVAKESV